MIKDPNWQERRPVGIVNRISLLGRKVCHMRLHKRYKLVIFLSAFLFPLHLTSLSCHVTVYFQWVFIVLGVDPVLPVSFRIPRVPDVLTGMSSIMRVPTFGFDWKQKERDKDIKKSLEFEMCWKLRLLQVGITVSYQFLCRIFPQTKLSYTNIDNFVSFCHSHKIRHWGIQSRDIPEKNKAGNAFARVRSGGFSPTFHAGRWCTSLSWVRAAF